MMKNSNLQREDDQARSNNDVKRSHHEEPPSPVNVTPNTVYVTPNNDVDCHLQRIRISWARILLKGLERGIWASLLKED